jgi:hypothetical protein
MYSACDRCGRPAQPGLGLILSTPQEICTGCAQELLRSHGFVAPFFFPGMDLDTSSLPAQPGIIAKKGEVVN